MKSFILKFYLKTNLSKRKKSDEIISNNLCVCFRIKYMKLIILQLSGNDSKQYKYFFFLITILDLMNGKVSSLKCYSTQGPQIQDCLINGPQFQCAVLFLLIIISLLLL